MATTYLEPAAVIAEIQSNVATIRGKPADDKLALYAKYFVAEVLDYCNRDDFPQALCMTGADVVGRWLDDMENGGRNALKSIKQDDTEYQFAVSDASQAGSTLESDLAALRPRLNLYRKPQVDGMTAPWTRCRALLAKYMYRDKVTVTRQEAAVDEDGADIFTTGDVYTNVPCKLSQYGKELQSGQEALLTQANESLKEYAREEKRTRLRIKAQRNTWEAVAA